MKNMLPIIRIYEKNLHGLPTKCILVYLMTTSLKYDHKVVDLGSPELKCIYKLITYTVDQFS